MINENENLLNDLFKQAKTDLVQNSFDETKKRFIDSVQVGVDMGKNSLFNLKNGIMVTIISAIVVATIIQVNQPSDVVENAITSVNQVGQIEDEKKNEILDGSESNLEVNIISFKEKSQTNTKSEVLIENEFSVEESENDKIEKIKVRKEFETVYRFPILTEKEEIENQKRKRRMMKNLVKFNKKEYAFIPSGSLKTENSEKSINSFYIGVAEVTNIQYRTFLIDLVMKGEKEKYNVASPKLGVWSDNSDGTKNPLNKAYFSHPAYDNYPVVGISQKGAELYCAWLSKEVVAYYPSRKIENTFIKVRIPSDVEWMYVANEGGGEIKHQWSSEGLQNEAGCYLANFKQDISDDGAVYTAKTKTYFSNEFGVYNLFGNVAELVYYLDENSAIGVKGGGWQSSIDELDIDYVDPNKGNVIPSSNVGFRVVISFVKN